MRFSLSVRAATLSASAALMFTAGGLFVGVPVAVADTPATITTCPPGALVCLGTSLLADAYQQARVYVSKGTVPPPPPPGTSAAGLVEYALILALIAVLVTIA